MKPYISAIMLLLAIVALTPGCKKDKQPTQATASGLVKTILITDSIAGGTFDSVMMSYTYDNQNRVIQTVTGNIVNGHLNAYDSTFFAYGANSVIQSYPGSSTTVTITLNSQGFEQSDNLGDSWTYNAAGYVTQSITGSPPDTVIYAYDSLNRVITETTLNGNTSVTTFGYQANVITKPTKSWNTGQISGYLYSTTQTAGFATTESYLMNSQDLVTKETIVNYSGQAPYTRFWFYTYY